MNRINKWINVESLVWVLALLALGFMHPEGNGLFSFCLLKNLGIDFCPGCGLGHSISFLLHGRIADSLSAHPLGIVAVVVLTVRILKLTFTKNNSKNKSYSHAIWKHL